MAAQMTKSQLIEKIAAENEMGKKDVKGVLEDASRPSVIKNSRRQASFSFLDLQSSLLSRSQQPRRARAQIRFSGEPMMFKAKPARRIVRARPVKAAKMQCKNYGARGAWTILEAP